MMQSCYTFCRSALEKTVQDCLLRTNTAIGCKLPPKQGRKMQVLGGEEVHQFLIQVQAEDYYYELFLLDLCTDLRQNKLMALL